jgi:hypothetical protein
MKRTARDRTAVPDGMVLRGKHPKPNNRLGAERDLIYNVISPIRNCNIEQCD